MNVVVTGANGFLGSHLVRKLTQLGHSVYGLVRPTGTHELLKDLSISLFEVDIRKPITLDQPLPQFDVLFHLAAVMGTAPHLINQLHAVNVTGTKHVLEWAIANRVKRFVHVSSTVAFGALSDPDQPLIREDEGESLRLPHLQNFESKRLGQEMVLEAAHKQNLDAVVVNPSLIFGAGDARKSIRKGHINIAKGRMPFALPGGINIVHVQDVVDGLIAAWQKGRKGQCYILGGQNIFTRELFTWIAEAGQSPPQKRVLSPWLLKGLAWIDETLRIGSELNREAVESLLLYHWCDSSKAKQELDYHPRSPKGAIIESVNWMKENGLL